MSHPLESPSTLPFPTSGLSNRAEAVQYEARIDTPGLECTLTAWSNEVTQAQFSAFRRTLEQFWAALPNEAREAIVAAVADGWIDFQLLPADPEAIEPRTSVLPMPGLGSDCYYSLSRLEDYDVRRVAKQIATKEGVNFRSTRKWGRMAIPVVDRRRLARLFAALVLRLEPTDWSVYRMATAWVD
ncbi:hypothetical protein [Paludisphaera rhizosphaerae]|uniref:hypothetical protein n=1 Tax=Paludisphaera rhizosphaerae TaxID=2711216 RepID=UPI0013EB496D|nr:hypothetical protein [Paludisphaera rhizosphaerae]